mgnify:CR=1 FL=1
MQNIVYIGNRKSIVEEIDKHPHFNLIKVFFLKDAGSISTRNSEITLFDKNDFSLIHDFLQKKNYDICASGGCPFILPVDQYDSGRIFINSHPSLLPFGKGIHPINEVFLSGRESFGSTVHFLTNKLDGGDIIEQAQFKLTNELDVSLVYSFIFKFEADVFRLALDQLSQTSDLKATKQDDHGTYYSRKPGDEILNPASDCSEIFLRKIKAFSSKNLGAALPLGENLLRVFHAEKISSVELIKYLPPLKVGDITKIPNTDYIAVRLKDGYLVIKSWFEGK